MLVLLNLPCKRDIKIMLEYFYMNTDKIGNFMFNWISDLCFTNTASGNNLLNYSMIHNYLLSSKYTAYTIRGFILINLGMHNYNPHPHAFPRVV